MSQKRIMIISIIAIILIIGGSFAYYEAVVHGTGNTNMEGSAHTATIEDLILTGTTEVVNTNMIPGESSEYSFTIENPNSFPVCFGLYFENITNTFVNKSDLEVSLNGEVGIFPATGDTSTIIGGFKAKANSTTSYTLTVTYKDVVGKDQMGDIGKKFEGTIKARPTECGLEQSTKTINMLASLNSGYTFTSNSDKCLSVDANGMILNPNSTMTDSDTPIICTMEDDYGTSYYLRGLHTNNNVKFANMCWKIVRVTGTGGIKMIYNGDVDANGKCTTTSGEHNGFTRLALSLSGNKLYGTSYTKEGSTYTLSDTSTLNWPNDTSSIIGKYTCNSTSNTCSTLYAVTGEYNTSIGYSVTLDQSTNYAQIGTSAFNAASNSPAYVGYMFNDAYTYNSKDIATSGATIISSNQANTSNYYYGDTISYNSTNGYYYITNQDNSDVVQLDWASNYQNNLVGKYTCKGTSKYDNKTIRCKTAYKVIDTTTKKNYMISENLTGGRLSIGNINLASSYTYDGTIYTLTSPVSISAMDWYNGYSSYNNYYICGDWNQTTCNDLRKITSARQTTLGTSIIVNNNNNYYYGSSFTYDESQSRPYTLTDTVQFWDIYDSTNTTLLNTHHYTCFYGADNTCDELYFIYYLGGTDVYYIKLNGNETVSDALDKMLRNDNINVKNSHIKGVIDYWYKENILGTEYESKLEDTVFCNDRTISDLGGWSETGAITGSPWLKFNAYNSKYYLKCPNKRDAFTVSDEIYGNSALTYPVGLLTTAEHRLIGNDTANKTWDIYWSSAPYYFDYDAATERHVDLRGYWSNYRYVTDPLGVRPAVSLRPGTTFKTGGDGSVGNPFEIE